MGANVFPLQKATAVFFGDLQIITPVSLGFYEGEIT